MGESRNWQTRRLQVPHGAGSNPASPTPRSSQAMPIRSTGRTTLSESVNCGSNPRWAATPPRTAAAPLSYGGRPGSAPGGGSPVLVLQHGREASPRCWMLRVRLPPSARSQRFPMGGGAPSPSSCLLSGNGKHASPVWRQPGFDSPSRLVSVHAVVAQLGQSVSMPRRGSPVQIWSAARMRLWWNLGRHAGLRSQCREA
jgi:hypothetical protein